MEPGTPQENPNKTYTVFLATGLVLEIAAVKNISRYLGEEQTIVFLDAEESVVGFFRLNEISGMSFTDSLSILNNADGD